MKVTSIRNVRDELYRVISRLPVRKDRSIQQEVLVILECKRFLENDPAVEMPKQIRESDVNRREPRDGVYEIRQE